MSVIAQLATSLGRRDEEPNIELAANIARESNGAGVLELITLLRGKNKHLRADAIKVLYELGAVAPEMIKEHTSLFVSLLTDKNNRLQWGAMTALQAIASIAPDSIYPHLSTLDAAAASGTVITRDNYVKVLAHLCKVDQYYADCINLLLYQLRSCPDNQLPMYAEVSNPILRSQEIQPTLHILADRLDLMEQQSKRARIEKVMKNLNKRA